MTAKIDKEFPVGSVVTHKAYKHNGLRLLVLGRKKFARAVTAIVISPLKGYEDNEFWGVLGIQDVDAFSYEVLADEEIDATKAKGLSF